MIPRVERRQFDTSGNGIFTKESFRKLEREGALGNHFESWPCLTRAFLDGKHTQWVTIRSLVANSPFMVPVAGPGYAAWKAAAEELVERGARWEDMYFQEIPAPGNTRTINFEVYRNHHYLWLTWGTGQINLRQDLEENGQVDSGLRALTILNFHLDDEDWQQLNDIWDRWPNATIEASRWTQRVGVLNQRLIIWEARQY